MADGGSFGPAKSAEAAWNDFEIRTAEYVHDSMVQARADVLYDAIQVIEAIPDKVDHALREVVEKEMEAVDDQTVVHEFMCTAEDRVHDHVQDLTSDIVASMRRWEGCDFNEKKVVDDILGMTKKSHISTKKKLEHHWVQFKKLTDVDVLETIHEDCQLEVAGAVMSATQKQVNEAVSILKDGITGKLPPYVQNHSIAYAFLKAKVLQDMRDNGGLSSPDEEASLGATLVDTTPYTVPCGVTVGTNEDWTDAYEYTAKVLPKVSWADMSDEFDDEWPATVSSEYSSLSAGVDTSQASSRIDTHDARIPTHQLPSTQWSSSGDACSSHFQRLRSSVDALLDDSGNSHEISKWTGNGTNLEHCEYASQKVTYEVAPMPTDKYISKKKIQDGASYLASPNLRLYPKRTKPRTKPRQISKKTPTARDRASDRNGDELSGNLDKSSQGANERALDMPGARCAQDCNNTSDAVRNSQPGDAETQKCEIQQPESAAREDECAEVDSAGAVQESPYTAPDKRRPPKRSPREKRVVDSDPQTTLLQYPPPVDQSQVARTSPHIYGEDDIWTGAVETDDAPSALPSDGIWKAPNNLPRDDARTPLPLVPRRKPRLNVRTPADPSDANDANDGAGCQRKREQHKIRRCISDESLLTCGGSQGHPHLCARLCLYFWKGECRNGKKCSFCHFPHVLRPPRFDKRHRSLIDDIPLDKFVFLMRRACMQKAHISPDAELQNALDVLFAQMPSKAVKIKRISSIVNCMPLQHLIRFFRRGVEKKLRVALADPEGSGGEDYINFVMAQISKVDDILSRIRSRVPTRRQRSVSI